MTIVTNGQQVNCRDGLSVTELLFELKVKMPDMVSVELNGTILSRADFDKIKISDGDKVEFLYFMGGGTWD